MDALVVSSLGVLWKVLLCTFSYAYKKHVYSFLLFIYLEEKLLGHSICIYSAVSRYVKFIFQGDLYQFILLPTISKYSVFTYLVTLDIIRVLNFSYVQGFPYLFFLL